MSKKDALIDAVDALEGEDYETAYKLFLPLAEQGNAEGQFNLGRMYAKGQGVPQDYKEAFRLFRLAAEQGNAKSFRSTFIMFGLLRGLKDRDIADNYGNSLDIIHKYYAKYINIDMIGESFTDLPDG